MSEMRSGEQETLELGIEFTEPQQPTSGPEKLANGSNQMIGALLGPRNFELNVPIIDTREGVRELERNMRAID